VNLGRTGIGGVRWDRGRGSFWGGDRGGEGTWYSSLEGILNGGIKRKLQKEGVDIGFEKSHSPVATFNAD